MAALKTQRAALLETMQTSGWMVGALHNWVSRWDQGGVYLLKSINWTSAVDLQTTGLHFVNVAKMYGADDDPYGYHSARKTINLNLESVKDKKPLGAGTILNPPAGWSRDALQKRTSLRRASHALAGLAIWRMGWNSTPGATKK